MVAQGATPLENPTSFIGFYGYENDVVSAGDPTKPQMVPTQGVATEAQKTEPDENTHLSFKNALHGADPNYYYGKRFLYQGHEAAASVGGVRQGYITRINLDADSAHRVTLLAATDSSGAAINTIDGSRWDPWARKLIFTTENANAPTYSATPDYPSTVTDVSGALGRGGYEGVALDSEGNAIIVEDIGGANKGGTTARIPNSFLFRYVPDSPGDLENGKLQVLQVLNNVKHQPITQATQTPLHSPDQVALHVYGSSFEANWKTIHDTAVNGHSPFNAKTLAKANDGTPFKRPENGRFRPGTGFRDFYFDETGDTNATSPENVDEGGWCLGLQAHEQAGGLVRTSVDLLPLRRHAGGLRQHGVPLARPDHVRRGRGRHPAWAAECARLGLGARRDAGLLRPVEPARTLARRGPRPVGDDRLRGRRLRQERRRQRDHGHGGLRRRHDRARAPGGHEPASLPGQGLALLLHRAARGQPHVRGRPSSVAPRLTRARAPHRAGPLLFQSRDESELFASFCRHVATHHRLSAES